MRRRVLHQGIEEGVARERVGPHPRPLHLVEDLHGQVRVPALDVRPDRGVQEILGRPRDGVVGGEDEAVEVVRPVGSDKGDEEAPRVGELAVREERREEGEEEGRGAGEGGVVGLAPSEEGEEGVGAAG